MIEPPTFSKEQYDVMVEVRDLQIEDLLHALRQVQNNQAVTSLLPLLTRTIRERNELEEQMARMSTNFTALNEKYNTCKQLTEHFTV